MLLVFFTSFLLCFIFVLPVVQQGVVLVVFVFGISVFMSSMISLAGFSWYGFSLFLIYVGGLLVMFGYVVSMVPNLFLSRVRFLYFLIFSFFLSFFLDLKLESVEGSVDVGSFLYGDKGVYVLVGLGLVLFLSLVCVVKICYFSKASLRPFMV